MIVVSDVPPLNYLALIGCPEVLERLFGNVFIPPAVAKELSHLKAPAATRGLLQSAWLHVQAPRRETVDQIRGTASKRLAAADIEAIGLAKDLKADYLLTDDKDARSEAEQSHNIQVTGTLGVLALAARRGLVQLPDAIERLRATRTFRISEELLGELIRRDAERGG